MPTPKIMMSATEANECFEYNPASGEIHFAKDRPRSHFISDHASLIWHKRFSGKLLSAVNTYGYIKIHIRLRGVFHNVSGHRVAFACMTGRWPEDVIDHKNGIKSDNRWENLRECTRSENTLNTPCPSKNSTGVKNVSKLGDSFRVLIRRGRTQIYKKFETLEHAAAWARQKREELHGEFANHTQPTESGASE